ncbi:RlpA-like double-psi beta-barrel-protein domain-containing protein-containing protein [Mycena filopes]|nr:RlpA-like double-psi beta-barrel-protein domain-containing protein-containing protein [Mycena filopes]
MSRATLILSLFVFLIALPTLNATATLSRGRSVIPHRAIAGRLSIPRSGSAVPLAKRKRCKAKSSSVSSSAATATVQAVHVDTTTTAAQVTTSSSKVTPTSTTEAAATTTKTTAAETTHQTTKEAPTETQPTTKEAPTTTTTHKATTTQQTTTAKAQTTTQSSGSSGSSAVDNYFAGVNTGEGTFYNTGLDACGFTDSDSSSYIAAVSIDLFDNYPGYNGANPNNNPVCNRQVKATYQGKTVTVRIVDRCTGCASKDLDFSPLAFQELADPSVGRLTGVTWEWV